MFCDLHADTPTRLFTEHKRLDDISLGVHTGAVNDLGSPLVQLFAIWHDPEYPKRSDAVLDSFLKELKHQSTFHLATSSDELQRHLQNNHSIALLSIEGGNMLQGNLDRLDMYYRKGVRFLTLVWNGKNDLAGAQGTDGDLTDFGRAVLCRMRTLRMTPDLSHCNEKSFWSIAERGGRLFCSHSNARHVYDHPRNLTDEQIRTIIASDGLIGLTVYPPFVNGQTHGTLSDLLPHIEHICSLGGTENLAIGSDLDGIDTSLHGCENSRFFLDLSKLLEQNGFDETVIRKILGENFLDKFCNF